MRARWPASASRLCWDLLLYLVLAPGCLAWYRQASRAAATGCTCRKAITRLLINKEVQKSHLSQGVGRIVGEGGAPQLTSLSSVAGVGLGVVEGDGGQHGARGEERGRGGGVRGVGQVRVHQVEAGLHELAGGAEGGAPQAGQEVGGRGHVHLEVDHAQQDQLHVEDFLDSVRVLGEPDELAEVGRVVLLHLAGHVEGGDAHQLELVVLYVAPVEDPVQQEDAQVE